VPRFLAPVWAARHPEATVHCPQAHRVFHLVTVVALWSVVAKGQRTVCQPIRARSSGFLGCGLDSLYQVPLHRYTAFSAYWMSRKAHNLLPMLPRSGFDSGPNQAPRS